MKAFIKDFPQFSKFFNFDQFNQVQKKCCPALLKDNKNIVVSAPTSSGKTVIFQLAIIKQLKLGKLKCLYLAPIKSLCHQKSTSWSQRFKGKINMLQLTSDTTLQQQNSNYLDQINLIVATPEKIDSYSRKNLSFLSKINLLLIDQIHMLNFEERGAILQAVVSRIISLSSPRIIAVSATIPNIKQVAQWLKANSQMTFVFGEQYRPVKINKVVLGFKTSNNPYTFERLLNYKLTQVIRSYSQDRGVLVFCQTQKGTQMACQQIITDMRQRQFIDCDQTLLVLIQNSKRVNNSSLQIMLPQGIAFHNAGLNMHDRAIVQKLFLDNKIRILCTTSTLAMGINLPARLVVIKSTQCYRGSAKGYDQYTQIQIDQMIGRAGRPPFDKQGTVVIMTEKKNYNKYLNCGKLQTLESHLYSQLNQHINAQISLGSIKGFQDVIKYFTNSFCYIRMKNSPASYSVKDSLQIHVSKICMQSINKLKSCRLILNYNDNQRIVSTRLGSNVAQNSIQIQTICTILKQLPNVKSQRDFLSLLCESQQIKRYRNKLDQRKLLKQINEKNKYILKTTISTSQKKCYVLVQSELDGKHIQNWQLRKQAKQIIYFFKRLTFCVKTACQQLKLFWPFFWSYTTNKYFSLKFWERNEQMVIRQFQKLNEKWKMISTKGFKNISQIVDNIHHLDTICQKNSQFSQSILKNINTLKQSVSITLKKPDDIRKQYTQQNEQQHDQQHTDVDYRTSYINQNNKDTLMIIKFDGEFDEKFKSIIVIVGQSNQLYTIRTLKQGIKQIIVALKTNKIYSIGIIKINYIGFDQFYQVINGRQIKKISNICALVDTESDDKMNKVNKQKQKRKSKANQQHVSQKVINKGKIINVQQNQENIQNKSKSISKQYQKQSSTSRQRNQQSLQKTATMNRNIQMKAKKANKKLKQIQSRKKCSEYSQPENSQDQNNRVTIKPGTYIPLNQYKCWKPGFRQFQQSKAQQNNNRLQKNITAYQKKLLFQQSSQHSKKSVESSDVPASKHTKQIQWQKYACGITKNIQNKVLTQFEQKSQNKEDNIIANKQNSNQIINCSPYNYFLNLFNKNNDKI